MPTQVVSVSSRIPTQPYYHYSEYLASLSKFGVTPTILGMDEPFVGLMTKPNLFRTWLRAGLNTTDRIILADAWDVVFCEHPDAIGERCESLFGDATVFNGEKGCWPRADLAEHFPDDGSPWRYLNSGIICGLASNVLAILEFMGLEAIGLDRRSEDGSHMIEPNDQGEFQRVFVEQPVPMVVDTQCSLAQTLSACEMSEFDLTGEQIRNKITGTTPGVFHFNGGAKEICGPSFFARLDLA
jgi:hypothetical protein